MLKCSGENVELATSLKDAQDTMLSVLAYLNDSMHQVAISGYEVSNILTHTYTPCTYAPMHARMHTHAQRY